MKNWDAQARPFLASARHPALMAFVIFCLAACFSDKGKHVVDSGEPDFFTREVKGLELVNASPTVALKDGDTLRLTAAPVKKFLRGQEVRMLAYNGSIPGPLIKVQEGASITVLLKNHTGLPTSLHSHGVRMEARFDGTPGITNSGSLTDPILDGGSGVYRLRFPDPGIYWYHSHVREDYSQELGLYGNYWVIPKDTTYWDPVDREVVLMIDDILMDSGGIAQFRTGTTNHALMGRFGNLFLVNGDTAFSMNVKRREVVRFYVTNACNTRVLNLGLDKHIIKVMGSDNGRFEMPQLGQFNYLAPGERIVFECYFQADGVDGNPDTVQIVHSTPTADIKLGMIHVLPDSSNSGNGINFWNPDSSAAAVHSIDPYRPFFDKAPDEELFLTVRMGGPMAMKSSAAGKTSATQHDPTGKGIEWEDVMGEVNASLTSNDITWIVRDIRTGKENMDIHWSFKHGDKIKIRIVNDSVAMHPMPHPIHFHGQRFLVTAVNGVHNYVEMGWKDTYLVGRGETVDLLLDADNPGEWMAHCHISEHLASMMMFGFEVKP